MPGLHLVVIALVVAIALGGCDDPADPLPSSEEGEPQQTPTPGTLVFSTFEVNSGAWGVSLSDHEGQNIRKLDFPRENPGTNYPDLVFFEFQWNPDGTRLIYRATGTNTEDWYLVLLDPATGSRQALTPFGGYARDHRWSPAGDRLLYVRGGLLAPGMDPGWQTAVVDLQGTSVDLFLAGEHQVVDGKVVYLSNLFLPDSSIWNVVPARYEAEFLPGGRDLIVVGAMGKPLTSGSLEPQDIELFRVSGTTGRIIERVTNNAVDERGFRLSPDGRHVLLPLSLPNQQPRQLFILSLESPGEPVRLATGSVEGMTWANDSRHVVFVRAANGIPSVFVVDRQTPGSPRMLVENATLPDLFLP